MYKPGNILLYNRNKNHFNFVRDRGEGTIECEDTSGNEDTYSEERFTLMGNNFAYWRKLLIHDSDPLKYRDVVMYKETVNPDIRESIINEISSLTWFCKKDHQGFWIFYLNRSDLKKLKGEAA